MHDVVDVVIADEFGVSDECYQRGLAELAKRYDLKAGRDFKNSNANNEGASKVAKNEWPEVVDFFQNQQCPLFPMETLNPSERLCQSNSAFIRGPNRAGSHGNVGSCVIGGRRKKQV